MKKIIQLRWIMFMAWIAITASTLLFAPSLQQLVAEKGQITVPEGYSAQEASELLAKMSAHGEKTVSSVLVFHNDSGLSPGQKNEVIHAIEILEQRKNELGISNILAFTDDPAIEEQTVSEDETTILVPFELSLTNQTIEDARENLNNAVANSSIDHYLTGEQFIEEDIIINSEEGLKKTVFITIGLILVILFVVFRSFVAPFIPLLTIGISYLVAEGIVAILAKTIDFPLSTFTQIFMIAVMFGIGTDYCILLISRFKEELANHDTIEEAVVKTYQSGGKTIFYASLAVLVGFSAIGLSTFSLYQSAVSVAIGVAVVLIALPTLVPFFFVLLGKRLFWPFDQHVAHKESKIWGSAGRFAWARPLLAIGIVLVITVPALLSYTGDKSYNSLDEIGDGYDSVKAFDIIAESFGPGQTLPTTVVMEVNNPIETSDQFQDIEYITEQIARMDGVDQVRSATRPAGEVIEDFLVENQTGLLADGIGQSLDGLKEIQDGLTEATDGLKDAPDELNEAKDSVQQLMDGTNEVNEGVGDISDALSQIEKGIKDGTTGAKEIKESLQFIKKNLDDTINGNKHLLSGYKAITKGLKQFGSGIGTGNPDDLDQLIKALKVSKENIDTMLETTLALNPELEHDEDFMTAYGTAQGQIDGVIKGIEQLKEQLVQLAGSEEVLQNEVINPLKQLNSGFNETITGQEQLSAGIGELINGIEQLESGLKQAAEGQGEVVNNIPSLQDGLSEIYGGQNELKNTFEEMQDQFGELLDGLTEMNDGLGQIDSGLSEVQRFLDEIEFDTNQSVVVIPDEALENEDFNAGIEPYLSDDKTITKFEVILSHSPYSLEAIQLVEEIKTVVNDNIQNTIFNQSDPKIGGISSMNNDLQQISDADYSRTAFLMVIGIFIILVVLLKSLIMPIYLIGSLMLTYFTSMAFTELIFVNILGYDGLTWAVPFFAFVMLTALGIDYSIFLMDRFNEERNGEIKDTLISAMKNMGTVIISAAIILGGTFAAMLPSGVLSLLQIATAVITGLFLYAFVMLPLFVPVMVRLFGKANWWPFKRE